MSSQRVAYSLLASAGVASAGVTSFYFGPQLSDVYFAERLLAKEQSLLSRLETGLETRAKTLRDTERENAQNILRSRSSERIVTRIGKRIGRSERSTRQVATERERRERE